MADMIKFYKGLVETLPATGTNGALYITTDEGGIYLGTGTGMKRLGDFVQVANVASLPEKAHENCLYYCVAENILAKWNGTEWKQVNKQPTTEELKTLLGLGSMAYKSEVAEGDLNAELAAKVNAAADGNHSHANKAELDKIAEGDKAKWDAAEQNAKDYADTELAKKVDKVTGKSLVDDAEITKLAGVSEGANKVEASETNGNIKIDGVETTVYTHPAKHNITDIEGLQDALDGKQGTGDYAAEDHKHVKADITDFDHTHAASEITDLDATIKAYKYATQDEAKGYADAKDEAIAAAKKAGDDAAAALATHATEAGNTYETKADASAKLAEAKKYTDEEIAKIPEQTDYTVTITENTDDATVAKTYVFTQNGAEIGAIKLAKELVVTSGSVKEVDAADVPYAGAKVGDKYIELVIANQDAPIYVPAKDLVDIYTAKDGAAEVQVAISNTNEISATLVNGGITEEKLADGVKTKLNKVWEEVGVAAGLDATLKTELQKEIDDDVNAAIGAEVLRADDAYDKKGDAAAAQSAAEATAANALATARTEITAEIDADVKNLADGQVKTNADAIENITKEGGLIATAESNAKAYAEAQVTALAGNTYTKEQTYTKAEVETLLEAQSAWGEF